MAASQSTPAANSPRLAKRLSELPAFQESAWTPPPPPADEEAAIAEWETRIDRKRPPSCPDALWEDFSDPVKSLFDIGSDVHIETRGSGRLIAKGIRQGKDCALIWPENHVIDGPPLPEVGKEGRPVSGADEVAAANWLSGAAPLRISRHIGELLANPSTVRWLKRGEIERGVIAVMSGPRGSYKSSLTLEWIGHVAVTLREPVLWCTAEGSGTDRRFGAWLRENAPDVDAASLPLRVVERRHDLNSGAGLKLISDELAAMQAEFGKAPALCVVDTYSKYSGGLDENSNSEVKQFITGLDASVRRKFDCACLLVAHTGLSDKSRARGASALEADTDAAYVVAFDGAHVSLSRDRFKDSPSLPPLLFTPHIVDLGRTDAEGEPVTAVVLKALSADALPRRAAKQPALRGANQKAVYAAVKELSVNGAPVEICDVIDRAIKKRPRDSRALDQPSDDDRFVRRNYRDALQSVADTGRCRIAGEVVYLGGPVEVPDFEAAA